ncbi:MAG: hypothetical protein HY864_00800 [Chloroflexi bacterium]|nr:hypothetical protein [Chloroflexota bacterium]
MKRKIVLILIAVALMGSACTLRVCTPAYVNAGTGEQVWICVSRQRGAAEPVVTLYIPYRSYVKR